MSTMGKILFSSASGITVLGCGHCSQERVRESLAVAPSLVAANGGALHARKFDLRPECIIGDADSLPGEDRDPDPSIVHHVIAEQETTDFDKCIRSISAPVIIGHGVLHPRLDHGMASISTVLRNPGRGIVLVGESDICTLVRPRMQIDVTRGARVSLVPMRKCIVHSSGLKWQLNGMELSMFGKMGTSNEAIDRSVGLEVDCPGLLLFLPPDHLAQLVRGLLKANAWPG